jgi:esterase
MSGELHYKRFGEGEPVIVLHGMYGSSDNWYSIGKELAENFEVYLVDQRNHGRSPHFPDMSYPMLADDIRDFLDMLDLWKVTIIGHSMGGKAAMFFAAAYPHRVNKLIIVDISPASYKELLKPSTLVLDHMNIISSLANMNLAEIESRTQADTILAETVKSMPVRQFLLKNLSRNKAGKFEWQFNLKAIEKALPALMDGMDSRAIEKGLSIKGFPILFIRGENSEYIKEKDVELIKKVFPEAEIKTVEGAGHWVHSEKPMEFLKVVVEFLEQ